MQITPKNKIHTVIFDLDGTLSDSALLTTAAFECVLPDFGVSAPPLDAVRRATGYANPEFYHILFSDLPRDIVARIGEQVEREELRLLPSLGGRLLFRGCRELLLKLKENGVRLCIASTGDSRHVLGVLSGAAIEDCFDMVLCGRPDKIAMLGEISGESDKSGYIMVGDMKKDYEGARANDILSVGACYGYCRKESSDFDFYINDPLELLAYIK